uniref:Uncharacterized protein n=1 Tax=Ixodes ricinus TaxID=34613 RepID=A0A6B0UDW9_IXORI
MACLRATEEAGSSGNCGSSLRSSLRQWRVDQSNRFFCDRRGMRLCSHTFLGRRTPLPWCSSFHCAQIWRASGITRRRATVVTVAEASISLRAPMNIT